MDDLRELVDLPDPSVQPLVHPLDLPEARGSFRAGWGIGVLAGPAVGVAVGTVAWSLSSNFLVAAIAGLSLVVLGNVASRSRLSEAWEYIPRKRQDRRRSLPIPWDLTEGIVIGGSVALTIVIVADRLADPELEAGVRQFVVGAGIATAVLVVIDLMAGLLMRRGPAFERPWLIVPLVIGVAIGGLAAFRLFAGTTEIEPTTAALLGAIGMTIVVVVVLVGQALAARRTPGAPDPL